VPKLEIIGHRGNGSGRRENTLASCLAATAAGANWLEVDVQLFGGELMLAHPPRKPKDSLENILANTRLPLVLHIKRRHYNPWHDRKVVDRLVPLLNNRQVTVASFWPGTVTYLKRKYPHVPTTYGTFWLGYDVLLAKRLGVTTYSSRYRLLSPRAVARAHAKGLRVITFTPPGNQRVLQKIRRLGVDGVITDKVSWYVKNA